MRITRVDKAQAGIKIAGRNISNLRYTDDSTLMAESEELKSLISSKVRNKTRVPTLTITIQHSFGSFGHSNQSRKGNKRNPNWKRRSKTLTICR